MKLFHRLDNSDIAPSQSMQCTLWDNHAKECDELQKGDLVRIDNLRLKQSSCGYEAVRCLCVVKSV